MHLYIDLKEIAQINYIHNFMHVVSVDGAATRIYIGKSNEK
jgi:hypothetical protein